MMTKNIHSQYLSYFSSENTLILCVSLLFLFLYALFTSINTQSRFTGHVCLLDCLARRKFATMRAYKSRKWGSMSNCFVIMKGFTLVYKCLLIYILNVDMHHLNFRNLNQASKIVVGIEQQSLPRKQTNQGRMCQNPSVSCWPHARRTGRFHIGLKAQHI